MGLGVFGSCDRIAVELLGIGGSGTRLYECHKIAAEDSVRLGGVLSRWRKGS